MKRIARIRALFTATSFLGLGTISMAQDVSVTTIDLSSQCGTPKYPITINVSNLGTGDQTNLDVYYQINNGTIISEVMSTTIPAGSNDDYTFNQLADLGIAGNYDIKAWVHLPSDVNNSNDTTTSVLNYVAPAVNVTNATLCSAGDSIDLIASGGMDNYIWYSESSSAYTSLDDTLSAVVNQEETYLLYLRDSVLNMSLSQIGATTDHDVLSGDDRGGIAVTDQYVYFNGDNNCARFTTNLSGGVSLPRRDGIFSDLSTGQLYTLFNTTLGEPVGSSVFSINVNSIVTMDDNLNFVDTIMLSQTIVMGGDYAQATQAGIYAGEGHVLLYTGTQGNNWYVIDLPSGDVTFINSFLFDTKSYNENWSSWGFSVYAAGAYRAVYTNNMNQEIRSINTATESWSTIQTFSNLADMASITYSPTLDRIYFHHEGNSQFGGFTETGGYMDAGAPSLTEVNQPYSGCPTTIVLEISSSSIDLGSDTTFCEGTPFVLDAGVFDTYQWSTGETTQTISVNATDTYSVLATDEFGCQRNDTIDINVNPNPVVDLGPDQTIDYGTSITLSSNGGFNEFYSYNWSTNDTTSTIDFTGYADTTIMLVITDANGCQGEDEIMIFVENDLGIQTIDQVNSYSIYPNPASANTNVAIEMNEGAELTISIIDVSGKSIVSSLVQVSAGENTINIPTEKWTDGLYLLNVSLEGNTFIQEKLIKH